MVGGEAEVGEVLELGGEEELSSEVERRGWRHVVYGSGEVLVAMLKSTPL